MRVEPIDLGIVRENRGWFVGLGISFLVLGILAILVPFIASLVTAVVLGWLLIVSGLFQIIHAFRNRRWGGYGWGLLGGVIQVIAGALIVAFPVTGTLTLTLILAGFFASSGILKIIRALQHRGLPAWGWLLFDGILSLALGVLIIVGWPGTSVWALGLLVGIDLVFSGASMLFIGLGAPAVATVGPQAR